jgi:hypothetical protein
MIKVKASRSEGARLGDETGEKRTSGKKSKKSANTRTKEKATEIGNEIIRQVCLCLESNKKRTVKCRKLNLKDTGKTMGAVEELVHVVVQVASKVDEKNNRESVETAFCELHKIILKKQRGR